MKKGRITLVMNINVQLDNKELRWKIDSCISSIFIGIGFGIGFLVISLHMRLLSIIFTNINNSIIDYKIQVLIKHTLIEFKQI